MPVSAISPVWDRFSLPPSCLLINNPFLACGGTHICGGIHTLHYCLRYQKFTWDVFFKNMWTVVTHAHEIAYIAGMFPVMWQRVCIFQRKGEIYKGVAVPKGKKKKQNINVKSKYLQWEKNKHNLELTLGSFNLWSENGTYSSYLIQP